MLSTATCAQPDPSARSARRLAPVALATLALAGCTGLSAGPTSPLPNHQDALVAFSQVYAPQRVAACLELPVAAQRDCRNTIGFSLMTAIDLRYAEFEAEFFDQTRYSGFAATLATLGLTAAGSVVASAATANILSAIAVGVTGAREAFARDVLAERTATALMTAMRSERAQLALRIRRGLQNPPERYPLGWALSDLYAYYRAGTIPGALTAVTRAVGAEGERAQQRLARQTVTGETVEDRTDRVVIAPLEPAPEGRRGGSAGAGASVAPAPATGGTVAVEPLRPVVVTPQTPDQANASRCLMLLLADADRTRRAENRQRIGVAMAGLVPPVVDVTVAAFAANPAFATQQIAVARQVCPGLPLAPAATPAPAPAPAPQ